MMTAEQIIQTICTDLADSPSISQYLQIARESLSSRFFGKLYEQAVAYKACHLFVLTKPSELNQMTEASGGSISSMSEGGISLSFNATNSDKELSSTKYGRMLLDLMKSRPTMDVNRNCRPPILIYPMI
jgi:hypothetical protein